MTPVQDVIINEELLPRILSNHMVEDYASAIAAGADFPPITITTDLVLIDGWHRLEAHRQLQLETIATVTIETDRPWFTAYQLNAKHGERLSPTAKQRIAEKLAYEHLSSTDDDDDWRDVPALVAADMQLSVKQVTRYLDDVLSVYKRRDEAKREGRRLVAVALTRGANLSQRKTADYLKVSLGTVFNSGHVSSVEHHTESEHWAEAKKILDQLLAKGLPASAYQAAIAKPDNTPSQFDLTHRKITQQVRMTLSHINEWQTHADNVRSHATAEQRHELVDLVEQIRWAVDELTSRMKED